MTEYQAEILIGRLHHGAWEAEDIWENCFALYVNNELVLSEKRISDDYLDDCKRVSQEFLDTLRKRKIKDYNVINGQRVRSENLERVECDKIPSSGLELFLKDQNFDSVRILDSKPKETAA